MEEELPACNRLLSVIRNHLALYQEPSTGYEEEQTAFTTDSKKHRNKPELQRESEEKRMGKTNAEEY